MTSSTRSNPAVSLLSDNRTMFSFNRPNPLVAKGLTRLVRLAAKTASADGSFLILNIEGEPSIAESFGFLPSSITTTSEWVDWCLTTKSPTDSDAKSVGHPDGEEWPIVFHPEPGGGRIATLVIRRGRLTLGIMGVWNRATSPSAAQAYVLQAITSEITDSLEAELLTTNTPPLEGSKDHISRLRMLESVVVNANDSVLITEAEPFDLPGPRIQYCNPAFTRTTGYSLEDVVGKTPRILQGPLSGTEAQAKIRAALNAWEPVQVELLNYRKDGSTFWVELSISPVCDEKGWYTHWVSVQRDITDRKAAEENVALMRAKTLQNESLTAEIRERRLAEAKLSYLAFHDSLTDLRNRIFFMDALRVSLRRARSKRGYRAAVIYLDLDGFKTINDTLGHRAGDLLLAEVGGRLKQCARPQDTLARLGGDEFTLLIDDLRSMNEAYDVAQRMLKVIQMPAVISGTVLEVTPSIGLCEVNDSYIEAEDILRDADTAMYRAKQQGNGQCVIFDESMHSNALAALQLKQQLHGAIEGDELELYYQPLIDISQSRSSGGLIFGLEALVRWNHPTRGFLAPADFIPLAESTGLIVPLGAWVLETACAEYQHLQRCSASPLCMSVNVSGRQLDEAGFFTDLKRAIDENGVPPHLLQLEITESIFLIDAGRIGTLFHDIRALGVKIALDDFGTGYSSLSYLERYPIDTLKIDQTFVQRLGKEAANVDIVQMIISFAVGRGMNVCAEGVEGLEQEAALAGYGCKLVQGYLYSRPIRLELIAELLRVGLPVRV